jgi:hypothetical protein
MKKIFALALLLLISGCGSDNKIIGKWTHTVNRPSATAVETCDYVENNTETCRVSITFDVNGTVILEEYVTTQEWHIKGGKILEKTLDTKILKMDINGEAVPISDSRYQEISNLILSWHPIGETLSRKITFKGDTFELESDDGKVSTYTRVR